ncbi:MAG: polysaccharide transporter [Chitinophagaceae bacterium]|nr:polysaccharide transporter [Chitinophagaceae bacterium]
MLKKLFLVAWCVVFMIACVTPKKLRYMSDLSSDSASTTVYDSSTTYRLKSGDILYLKVISSTDSKMELFNQSLNNQSGTAGVQTSLLTGNLIDEYGDIELPMVGLIKLSGLTLKEAEKKINEKMSEYLTYVTVSVKLLSFRVMVMGEVASPGIKQIDRSHVTILEALSMAGDMSDLANRKKVRLIRKEGNRNKVYTIDMRSVNMLASEYYYLRPDDVIYVEPLPYKSLRVSATTVTLGFSLLSITFSVIAILRR